MATAKQNPPSKPLDIDAETQARYDKLAKLASEDRPAVWAPHAPDSTDSHMIIGEFVRMEYGESDYGRHGILILQTDKTTQRSVWLLHDVLRNELSRQRPTTGDVIAIRYLGMQKGEKRSYTGWRVEVERNTPQQIDWDAIAPGQGRLTDSRSDNDDGE